MAGDIERLQEGGVDAIMFGNENDRPYVFKAPVEAVAAFARIIEAVKPALRVPFGVNYLWDPEASVALGAILGASFVREIFTGLFASDMGLWQPDCAKASRLRAALGRADMKLRVPYVLDKLAELDALWRAPARVRALLEDARSLPPPRPKAVCHGDFHFRHVLVEDGRMRGVIDWIDLCRGEPALDLQIVWSVLPTDARPAFFAEYGDVDEETLLRARVIAFHLAAALLDYGHEEGLPALEREALASLDRAASP